MKKFPLHYLLTFIFITTFYNSQGQQVSNIKEGTIEFERKQNIVASFNNDPHMQFFVDKNGSEIYTSYFTLTFNKNQSIYQFGNTNGPLNRFSEMPGDDNVIYRNLNTGKKVVQKIVNGQVYKINDADSMLFQWKLTDERKVIAGFDCIRANAIIYDSIYVVAFFSEQLLPAIGPESFSGLPGMILGVSIPHEHISWFATKINITDKTANISIPTGGQEITSQKFEEMLKQRVFGIPKYGPFLYKRALF